MSLTVQNLRAVGTGVEPASLLPGQICFNVTDKVLYVGDGSSFKTNFDGTQVAGVAGGGWYAMPMDFSSLGDYYVANPGYWGDVPTDQQVLTWSTALNHPIWTSGGGGGGGNQVYVVTNAAVAAASGATTSDKISAAIGVASPDEGYVAIVTGLPDDVYEGLYFFTTEWVKGAAYAYPSASEVIYDNTVTGLTPTVQGAIDDLDAAVQSATSIANTANSTANSALSIASAALPKAGGTMTGAIVSRNVNVQGGYSIQFNGGVSGTLNGISDSISSGSSNTAASSAAVRTAYLLAQAALPYAGGTMSGTITFAVGQTFPISGIDISSASRLGVVQVGTNINVTAGGVISVDTATTTNPGIVQLNNTTSSTSATEALTANQGYLLQQQINSLTVASNTKLAGSLDCSSGLVNSVTTDGIGAGFSVGSLPPAPAAGNANYYLIVTTGSASYSPPGGGGPYAPQSGDWFLSNGTAWQYLGVGARPSYASTTVAGIVQLATNADTQAGTNATLAVTPAGLQSKISDSTSTTSSIAIASSTAVKSAYDLANAALPKAGGTMTGDITLSGAGVGIVFNDASTVEAISDSVATTSSVTAASSTAVKSAYDLANTANTTANAALPMAGGTMTGAITFAAGQTFPISGIQDATTGQKGVVQVGTNIQVSSGTISVNSASTTQAGVVQLNDTVASTSTTQALTANQGYQLQQQINALATATNLTFAGTIDGSTGNMATVTTEGAGVGFAIGSPLPSPSATIDEYFVIVTTAGTMTPPGGVSTAVVVGDWFLASASAWTYIAAGFVAPIASTTTAGLVELATNAEAQAGTNSTNAVVPSALQSKMSDSVSTTSSTTIASSTAVKSAYGLANAAVPKSTYSALGTLVAGTGAGTIGGLSLGANGEYLRVNSSSSNGIEWGTLPSASTTLPGISQLTDSVSSTSVTTAATPNSVKTAWDLANAALPLAGGTMTGDIILYSQVPVDPSMPASKYYADQIASGFKPQTAVAAATTAVLPGTVTYSNGSSGVGATLTLSPAITSIDGVTITTAGTRILVKNQASSLQNGVYTYTSGGATTVLTRSTDADQPSELLSGNAYYVSGGTVNGTLTYVQIPTVATVGTSLITYTQSSTKPFHKYSNEWNVDPVAGDDTSGTGSEEQPYKTIAKALSVAGGSGARIVLHQGTYTENLTITNQNLDLWGANRNGATINGTVNFANTASSIRAYGIQFQGNVTHSGNGGLYLQQYTLASGVTLTKSGNGYLELDDGSSDTNSHSFSGAGYVNIFNSRIGPLTVNNASAIVTLFNNSSVAPVTVTSGTLQIINSIVFAATESGNAVSASAGTLVYLRNSGFYTPSGANARVNLPGSYSFDNVTLDRVNSTLGTNLGTVARFDSIDVFGSISANGSAGASGTFTSQDGKTITVTNGLITLIV